MRMLLADATSTHSREVDDRCCGGGPRGEGGPKRDRERDGYTEGAVGSLRGTS